MTGLVAIGRRLAAATVVVVLLASFGAPVAEAASFSVRLEAGPHPAVTYSSAWAVTRSRTVTLVSPETVAGSARASVAGRGIWLRIASGTLTGWWVAEGRLAYRPGFVGSVAYTPHRALDLTAGRWEVYRFGTDGAMTAAKGLRFTATIRLWTDRAAVIDGRRYVRVAAGTWAGWWVPGTLTAPQRITCSAGSPPEATTGRIVRSVPAATREIALSFDIGGRLDPAVSIVRFLELERVCATIFPTGDAAQTTIGRAVMAEVQAHPELFELGNHTVHHCNLRDGGGGTACPATRPPDAFVKAELDGANAVALSLAGRGTQPYWRPPYGAVDTQLVRAAAADGYPYTILWSTDTIDWRPVSDGGPTAASMAARVVASRTAGGIVLMHLGGYNTRDALPAMVNGLRAAGWTPTSISALYR